MGEQCPVERQGVQRVVGFAPEAELAREDVDDVLGTGDPRLGEVVEDLAQEDQELIMGGTLARALEVGNYATT